MCVTEQVTIAQLFSSKAPKRAWGDRDLWVVEEDDPDILYRDRPYRRLTIIRRLPHLQLLETQGEVGRIADIDRSPHHGSWGVSEQRDPSEKIKHVPCGYSSPRKPSSFAHDEI